MPRVFSRRSAVCAPSRRLHKSIAAKQKPTRSAVERSSDSTRPDNFRLPTPKFFVCLRPDVRVADCEIGYVLTLFRCISGSIKVANCMNQSLDVVPPRFDIDCYTVIARSLCCDWNYAGTEH